MSNVRRQAVQWRDYLLLRLVFALARPLSFRARQRLGAALGAFCWVVLPFRRGVVLENLRTTVGRDLDEPALRDLARAFYIHLGTTLMEFCGYWRLGPERLRALVDVEGERHVERVRDMPGGAVLVSGHFGNWELIGAWLSAIGFDVSYLVKTQANARVDRLQNDLRNRAGVGVIRTGPSIKELVRVLRGGGLVGLLGDQHAGSGGLVMDVLGRPASVFRGAAALAWRLRCPLVTGFLVRRPDGRHVLHVGEPILPDPEWDEETAVGEMTRLHTQRLEEMIRRHPEQYFWVHRRWKVPVPEETV